MTVLESLKLSTDYLEKKKIDSPRLNAELLLADILKCRRIDLYLKFDQPLKEVEVDKYREFISRRGKFEPLQYVTGKTEFYGLTFNVTPDVLIPRPETEFLIEEILKLFGARNDLRILDIGTGSGNIPVVLAKKITNAQITTIDISEKAVQVAKQNARLNEAESKIDFLIGDITQLNSNGLYYDIIVSNPPYISADEYPTLQHEITMHEPSIALTDSEDGLKFYRTIAGKAKGNLKKGGSIFFELGKGQHTEVQKILEENGFINISIVKDYQQIERVISGELK